MRRWKPLLILTILFAVVAPMAGQYASAGVEEDIAEIKRDIKSLKKDVSDIKKLFNTAITRAKKAAERTTSSTTIDDDPVLGSSDAPLTLVEFSDYQCPYCGRFFKNTYPVLKEEYIKTGKLRYVYRDFPLSFHKQAPKAHEAASCVGEQGKYWEMHDSIFSDQKKMEVEDLREKARVLGVDMSTFNSCLDSGKYAAEIKKDIADGTKAGVRGTPSFVLGPTNENGEVKGPFIRGAQPTAYFKNQIDLLLKQVSKGKSGR
jgi:protein-disulfide isomerase